MTLDKEDIEAISQAIFERLVKHQEQFEKDNNQYIISDEFGNSSYVSEEEYIEYEIEKLKDLEQMHVKKENFEAADIKQNKINKFKIKLKQLWKNNSK